MPSEDDLGLRLFKRAEGLKTKRDQNFLSSWGDIARYQWPDVSDINSEQEPGSDEWFSRLFTKSPGRASQACSVGVRNWVTPSTDPWLALDPPYNLQKQAQGGSKNPRMQRILSPATQAIDESGQDEATRWTGDLSPQLLNWFSESNFYSVIQPYNRSACTFGTSLMYMEEGKENLYKFEQFKIGTYCIAENDEKIVDTVFRWFKLTARQAEMKFGKSKLTAKIRKCLETKPDTEFKFIHCCFPNGEMRAGAIGPEGMAFASVYITEDEKAVVYEGGYEEIPYFCLRWARWGTENEVWGTSPGFECLDDCRLLNKVVMDYASLIELKAFPRVIAPDSQDGTVEMAAATVTLVKADEMARGVEPKVWMDGGNVPDVIEFIKFVLDGIEDSYFVPVFKGLSQLGDKITQATYGAIAMLQGEKLDQFTGTFDQYRTELINPLVRRAIGIAYRKGMLKDPPQSLMVRADNDPNSELQLAVPKISIKSRVTLAIAQSKILGIEKSLQTLEPFMQQNPQIADNLDWNQATRLVFRGNGADETILAKLKDTLTKQDARQKMQKQELALKAAEIAAKSAGQLGKAPPKFQEMAGGLLDQGAQPTGS
jgi:hypothetical protein